MRSWIIFTMCIMSWIGFLLYNNYYNYDSVTGTVIDKHLNHRIHRIAHIITVSTDNNSTFSRELSAAEYEHFNIGDRITLDYVSRHDAGHGKDPTVPVWIAINILLTIIAIREYVTLVTE